jgi:hypothetical protein
MLRLSLAVHHTTYRLRLDAQRAATSLVQPHVCKDDKELLKPVNFFKPAPMKHSLASPPFSKSEQLCSDLDSEDGKEIVTVLPGHPRLMLNDSQGFTQFLSDEFWAQDLEDFAPHLWVLSTFSSKDVNPLHKQKVKGREIIITEDPRLHLVWFHDRIYLKPLPMYLLSYRFWEEFLIYDSTRLGVRRNDIRKAALGYLRTYCYLI